MLKSLRRTQNNRILPLLPVCLAFIGMAMIVFGEPTKQYGFISAGTWTIFLSAIVCVIVMMSKRPLKENVLLLALCGVSGLSMVIAKSFSHTSLVSLFSFWELPIFLFYLKGGYRKQLNAFIYILFFTFGVFFICRAFADNAYIIMGPYGPVKIKDLMLGYSNPNKTSMYLIGTFFVLTTAVFYFRKWFLKVPFAVMSAIMFSFVLQTNSRMGIIMSIFFLCLFVFPKCFARSKTIKLLVVLVPLAFFMFVVFGEAIHSKIKILGGTFDGNRMDIFDGVLADLHGLELFFGDFGKYKFDNMHNGYVGVLATTGYVGLFVFMLCVLERLFYTNAFVERAYQKIATYAFLVLIAYSSVESAIFDSGSSFAMFLVALYCFITEKERLPRFGWRSRQKGAVACINMTVKGSTGKIMLQIAQKARENGFNAYTYSTNAPGKKYRKLPPKPEGHSYYGTYLESSIHYTFAYTFGRNGTYSRFATYRLLCKLEKYKPSILHLHNLHNYCINLPMLFRFIKKHDIRVVWTLHDCWAFTGHCPYYDIVECAKWQTGCEKCPQYRNYPQERKDTSRAMYEKKRKWFTGVNAMTLVTPSKWLAGEVQRSFLKDYPVQVIENGIDLSVFQPRKSDFKQKYGIKDEFVLLGVAFAWNKRKGLDVFIELAKRLSPRFKIVLVGTDANVDAQLPENVISIHRTQNQTELAEIYTASDLFVNPTREEVFGLVNVEALACGTPVITFRTGGSPECIDETCGVVVEKNDIDGMQREIERIERERFFKAEDCIARAQKFDMHEKFEEYIALYRHDGK